MNALQKKLIGALIGLARATDGNEHLITTDSTAVVMECLCSENAEDAVLRELLSKVTRVKRDMVPDCFLCANPCGKNSDYPLDNLLLADEEVRGLKMQILTAIRRLAVSGSRGYDPKLYYKALIVIGMDDYSADDLVPILREIETCLSK